MRRTLLSLSCIVSLFGMQTANADSFTYHQVRKDYIFDDGFGIPQTKTQEQSGKVEVTADHIDIDGQIYTLDEHGKYRSERGRAVDLTLGYSGSTLKNVRISKGHIVHQYDLEKTAPVSGIANK